MKRVSYLAICVLLPLMWITMAAGAGQSNSQAQASSQSEQIIPPKAGISWKEKVMMQRDIQNRAAASRNALMRQAAIERQKESRNAVQPKSPMEP